MPKHGDAILLVKPHTGEEITMALCEDPLGDPFDRQKGIDGWNQELIDKQVSSLQNWSFNN